MAKKRQAIPNSEPVGKTPPIDPTTPPARNELLELLREDCCVGTYERALKMLQSDRFQLFADVKADRLVGVVKSQTDKEREYICMLAHDGTYSCCTHNLRPCRGLGPFTQGMSHLIEVVRLCKHQVVLVLGLIQAGWIDCALVHKWIVAGMTKPATLDKHQMGGIFLRYKAAGAGEVHWRTTETIPEDYHGL